MLSEQVASIKRSFTALTNTSTATSLLPSSLKTPPPPYNLDCCLVCPTVLILTFVTVTLLRSGLWNHHSPRGSDLPPDLAQTLIRANQHTSQQCPEGITETSDPQVFLQTIRNLPLSLDKVPSWGAFSVFRDSMSSSEARIC